MAFGSLGLAGAGCSAGFAVTAGTASACPVKAIYEEADLPAELRSWIAINAERAPTLPNITDKQEPLPGGYHENRKFIQVVQGDRE